MLRALARTYRPSSTNLPLLVLILQYNLPLLHQPTDWFHETKQSGPLNMKQRKCVRCLWYVMPQKRTHEGDEVGACVVFIWLASFSLHSRDEADNDCLVSDRGHRGEMKRKWWLMLLCHRNEAVWPRSLSLASHKINKEGFAVFHFEIGQQVRCDLDYGVAAVRVSAPAGGLAERLLMHWMLSFSELSTLAIPTYTSNGPCQRNGILNFKLFITMIVMQAFFQRQDKNR